jgi:hypothetical protein
LKLFKYVEDYDGQSIRLSWKPQNPSNGGYKKTPSTRFWIIKDDKVKHDIAIGEGWDQPDDFDDNDNTNDSMDLDEALASENEDGSYDETTTGPGTQNYNSTIASSQRRIPDSEMLHQLAVLNVNTVEVLQERNRSMWEQQQFTQISFQSSPQLLKRPFGSSDSSSHGHARKKR